MEPEGAASVRAWTGFPPDSYGVPERIAKKKKVSLTWIVRAAGERSLPEQPDPLEQESGPEMRSDMVEPVENRP